MSRSAMGPTVPSINTEQMREVDRLMIEEYGIVLLQMMENAGRSLARLAGALTGTAAPDILVLAGKGGNGSGGMVAARHLHNMGRGVRVLLAASRDDLAGAPAHQADILRRMGVEMTWAEESPVEALAEAAARANLIIDAVIGYSLAGPPSGTAADLIALATDSGRPILSLDVPSGVDAGTGQIYEPSVRAAATLTLALPKTGFAAPSAHARLGDLYLADIGVPPGLYRRLGLKVGPLFAEGDTVALRWGGEAGWLAAATV